MKLKNFILSVFILISLFLSINFSYAGCCVNPSITPPCSYASNNQGCDGTFFSQNCSEIESSQCTPGCCCITTAGVIGGSLLLNISCQNTGGAFYSLPNTYNECNSFCTNLQSQSFTLRGYVKNATHFVSNATVTLLDRGGISTNTSSNGYYIFDSVLSGNTLTINAKKDQCIATVTISPFVQNTEKNITLDCCQYQCEYTPCVNGLQNRVCTAINPDVCEVDQYTDYDLACQVQLCEWSCTAWNPPFSNPNNPDPTEPCPAGYTQRTRTCDPIIVNNCEVGPTPNLRMDCVLAGSQCGNGILEPGEECDFLSTPPYSGSSNCPEGRRTYDWCNSDCTCKTPIQPTDCNINNPTYPESVTVRPVLSQRKINVSWSLPQDCANYVDKYTVYGCDNTTGNCNFINVSGALSKNTNNYVVLNTTQFQLRARHTYCFYLRTKFNNTLLGQELNSSISCIELGDDVCLKEHPQQWCDNYQQAVVGCDENNFLTIISNCDPDQYCGIQNGIASCLYVNDCDRCNGLFGIFGYQGIDIFLLDGNGKIECPTLSQRKAKKIVGGNEEFAGCFLDYSYTTVDKIYSCVNVTTCYDYKSKLSCESDYCGKFNIASNNNICEWVEYNKIFNKGVCRPKKEYVDQGIAVQNCSLCGDPLYNRIYGNCTEDTCSLYGYCYFKKSTGTCIDGYSVKCSDYENEEDCSGGRNVVVDTLWSQSGTTFTKIGGSNNVITESSDLLGIKRCEWNGTTCFRNADNLSQTIGQVGIDCRILDNNKRLLCERDITPPLTIIYPRQKYGRVMSLKESLNVEDIWQLGDNYSDINTNNRTKTWLYYSISDSFKYPKKILRVNSVDPEYNKIINVLSEIPDGLQQTGQVLYFFYFAEDAAKNLESVKNFSFMLDIDSPYVLLSTSLRSYQGNFDWGEWATDVFVNITLVQETSLPVTCYYNMTPLVNKTLWTENYEDKNIPSPNGDPNNIINNIGGSLSTAYIKLWPDRYEYNLKCFDDVENYYERTGIIRVDGDLTINSPFPEDGIFRNDSLPNNISIHTTANGVCKYSRRTSEYSLMEGTYNKIQLGEGDYLHYSPMSVIFAEELQEGEIPSGVYKFYTACNLTINNQNKIVVGDSADLIRFSIDDLPPITRLLYDPDPDSPGGLKNFTNNESREQLHLYLQNDDYTPVLDDNGYVMSFGQNKTYYCIRDVQGNCVIREYNLSLTEYPQIVFDYGPGGQSNLQYGPNPEFCYYSIDKGSNAESQKCIRLKLRNKEFLPPQITIIEN
ncbi:MAG: hypothetical protein KatS3mg002_0471 [Candidatus Woesearchaeota archaeon]|nr:MAG: hypothetical protein KatS3mg002_0471 [Candidatus Woesearchaeota archaeon]